MSHISVHGLTKRYGKVTAVDDLSFDLAAGSITGFLGANGAGKTTTMRMLLGLVRPSAGTATIDGLPYRRLRDPLRHIGAVIDTSGFHPGRSGRSALRVVATAGGIPVRRADDLLEAVGLADAADRRVGGYSQGMAQRLALAAALIGDPPTLVLDEPVNGLDPEGVHWVRGVLRRLAEEGRTVLVSSHLLAELAQTVDEVVIIDRGRLVAHDSTRELLAGSPSATLENLFANALEQLIRGPGKLVGGAMVLLGILGSAGEFRHRTAVATFLAEPRRQRVLAAKLLAYALAAVAIAAGVVGVTAVVAVPMLAARGVPVPAFAGATVLAVVGVTAVAVLYGALGVALGLVFRSQTAALGTALTWAFVIEGVVPLVTRKPGLGHWLPTGAADAVLHAGERVSGLLPAWGGAGLLAAYAAALVATGWALLVARDV
jgi:ABC-2 type transport system ATP-binding protein